MLSLITFLPLLGAIVALLMPESATKAIKAWTIGIATATFGVSLYVLSQFKADTFHFQFIEKYKWIPQFGISYFMGVDGIAIWLIALTTFLTVIALIFSTYINKRVRAYFALILFLESAMLGVFVSLDLVLFYTFFEFSLIPMFFLINIWGGERRTYAAFKFFIYTFAGSIFMLVGMVALANLYANVNNGHLSFNLLDLQSAAANGTLWSNAMHLQPFIFWLFALAFLVKCPAFPFHTWLPDAHVEAPTAGSVILAGVLLKMGTYGFLRFCLPLFPEATRQAVVPIMILAVVGIIYGAIVAAVQPDVKKLVAYSSVAHMGFVLLGIFSLTYNGLLGGSMQQLNHGISTGALFLLIGLIYERRHTRQFKDYGGIKSQMPIFATLFLIVMLSSVGLPGLNGFIGEFLAMLGAFEACFNGAYGLNLGFAVVAGFGVVLAAVYLLYMFQQMFYGKNENPENKRLKDLKPWEIAIVCSLVLFAVWGGLYPKTFLAPMEASVQATRLMVVNEPGLRPMWNKATDEIDMAGQSSDKGAFVEVAPRSLSEVGGPVEIKNVIAPANLHMQGGGQVNVKTQTKEHFATRQGETN